MEICNRTSLRQVSNEVSLAQAPLELKTTIYNFDYKKTCLVAYTSVVEMLRISVELFTAHKK